MREEQTPWKHGVVMVCAHERPEGASKPSCGKLAGTKLRQWLKEAARAQEGPISECRVMLTGCLDVCPHDGVTVGFEPGSRVVVVDPVADREALLALAREHVEGLAAGEGGARKKARRALGRLLGD
ncbi:MAG: hypothetical protein H6740_16890 [Alphaproteobacteria bacterium]|nr:hypothetical protein [Alphaproteobacteria bacterium]